MEFDPRSPPVPPELTCPLGGRIRHEPEDFVVDEIPLYPPSGEGEHLLVRVEKRGLTTPALLDRVARALGLRARDLGCAGYKDRHAVTRQWISVGGRSPEDLHGLDLTRAEVLEVHRHHQKLRLGHLRGNRFTIRVREPDLDGGEERVGALLEALARRGLPNGFGPQRFGSRHDNQLFGDALLRGDVEAFFDRLGTEVTPVETPRIREGRAALRDRDWAAAARLFPREFAVERHVALAMRKTGDPRHALRSLPPRARDFLVSAWQSMAFNLVLAARLDSFDRLLDGEVAWKHANGACFVVTDVAAETPRAEALEISPTGPLPGRKLLRPEGAAGEIEGRVLGALAAIGEESLVPASALGGVRRPLRVPVDRPVVRTLPGTSDLELAFSLPRGSFATAVLALLGVTESSE